MKDVIYVGRHSRYDTSLEEGKGGKLTDSGKLDAERIINGIASVFTYEELRNTRFLIVASKTRWKNNDNLGQRAIETGIVYRRTISKYLRQNCGMTPNEARNCFVDVESETVDPEVFSIIQENICEPNYWVKAPGLIRKLEQECGGHTDEFWHKLNVLKKEEVEPYGSDVEYAEVVAERMDNSFIMAKEWAKSQKGVNTCVIMISHGEALQPFYDRRGFDFAKTGYNEGIIVEFPEKGAERSIVHDASLKKPDIEVNFGKSFGDGN